MPRGSRSFLQLPFLVMFGKKNGNAVGSSYSNIEIYYDTAPPKLLFSRLLIYPDQSVRHVQKFKNRSKSAFRSYAAADAR